MANNIPDWVKVMMLKGDKGDYPVLSEEPIDNGYRITATNPDGTTFSFDVTNATSGDYSGLTNKPSINGNLISGNKTSSELGIFTVDDFRLIPYVVASATLAPGSNTVDVTIPASDNLLVKEVFDVLFGKYDDNNDSYSANNGSFVMTGFSFDSQGVGEKVIVKLHLHVWNLDSESKTTPIYATLRMLKGIHE